MVKVITIRYNLHEKSIRIHAVTTAVHPFLNPSLTTKQSALGQVVNKLHAGKVYRREDLTLFSNAVDRHLRELVASGKLRKLA